MIFMRPVIFSLFFLFAYGGGIFLQQRKKIPPTYAKKEKTPKTANRRVTVRTFFFPRFTTLRPKPQSKYGLSGINHL